jgi:hypothetical protein
MRFGKFLAARGKDWLALMSGIASVVLLFNEPNLPSRPRSSHNYVE